MAREVRSRSDGIVLVLYSLSHGHPLRVLRLTQAVRMARHSVCLLAYDKDKQGRTTHDQIDDLVAGCTINSGSVCPQREGQGEQCPVAINDIEHLVDGPVRLPYEVVLRRERHDPVPYEDGIVGDCAHLRDEDDRGWVDHAEGFALYRLAVGSGVDGWE